MLAWSYGGWSHRSGRENRWSDAYVVSWSTTRSMQHGLTPHRSCRHWWYNLHITTGHFSQRFCSRCYSIQKFVWIGMSKASCLSFEVLHSWTKCTYWLTFTMCKFVAAWECSALLCIGCCWCLAATHFRLTVYRAKTSPAFVKQQFYHIEYHSVRHCWTQLKKSNLRQDDLHMYANFQIFQLQYIGLIDHNLKLHRMFRIVLWISFFQTNCKILRLTLRKGKILGWS